MLGKDISERLFDHKSNTEQRCDNDRPVFVGGRGGSVTVAVTQKSKLKKQMRARYMKTHTRRTSNRGRGPQSQPYVLRPHSSMPLKKALPRTDALKESARALFSDNAVDSRKPSCKKKKTQ